jgi:hypothetical protein
MCLSDAVIVVEYMTLLMIDLLNMCVYLLLVPEVMFVGVWS